MKERTQVAAQIDLIARANNFHKYSSKERARFINEFSTLANQDYSISSLIAVALSPVILLDKKETRVYGIQMAQKLEASLADREVITKLLFDHNVTDERTFYLLGKTVGMYDTFSQKSLQALQTVSPRIHRMVVSGINMTKQAFAMYQEKKELPDRVVTDRKGDSAEREVVIKCYVQVATQLRQADLGVDKSELKIYRRNQYSTAIDTLFDIEVPPNEHLTHPLDILWGGTTLREIESMSKGDERDKKVLSFCAAIPKGDVFWRDVTANAFFVPITEHDPLDRFEETAKAFQVFFGRNFIQGEDSLQDTPIVPQQKFLQNYDARSMDKLGIAIAGLVAPKSGRPEDIAITVGFVEAEDTVYKAVHPIARNAIACFGLSERKKAYHPLLQNIPQAIALAQTLEKVLETQFAASLGQFSSPDRPVFTGTDPLREDILGERGHILRTLAIKDFFSREQIQTESFSLPESHALYATGFRSLVVNKAAEDETLAVQLTTEKNATLTAEITKETELRNCSWTVSDHRHAMRDIIDFSILALVSQFYKESGVSYPQLVILQAYGLAASAYEEDVTIDIEKARQNIQELENEDPQIALERRGLRHLENLLYPKEKPALANAGQQAIFELMQKAKRKGNEV